MKVFHVFFLAFWICYLSWGIYFKHQWKHPASEFCSFKLPHQYSLVKDSASKKYAVLFMHIDKFPFYLTEQEHMSAEDFYIVDGTVGEATLFDDSCSAKRALDRALRYEFEYKNNGRKFITP